MTINQFFQRVFVINLKRRPDRRALAERELEVAGIDPVLVYWVEGYDHPTNGNVGCTASHRELLRRIANWPWDRVLVLEDDFKVVSMEDLVLGGFIEDSIVTKTFCSVLGGRGNLAERFEYLLDYIPPAWDVLYLGGGYAEKPQYRYNRHVIRVNGVMTTSSYAVTRTAAGRLTERLDRYGASEHCVGPIDTLFSGEARHMKFFMFQPRLCFQRESKSDLNGGTNSYLMSMTDPRHERMV